MMLQLTFPCIDKTLRNRDSHHAKVQKQSYENKTYGRPSVSVPAHNGIKIYI